MTTGQGPPCPPPMKTCQHVRGVHPSSGVASKRLASAASVAVDELSSKVMRRPYSRLCRRLRSRDSSLDGAMGATNHHTLGRSLGAERLLQGCPVGTGQTACLARGLWTFLWQFKLRQVSECSQNLEPSPPVRAPAASRAFGGRPGGRAHVRGVCRGSPPAQISRRLGARARGPGFSAEARRDCAWVARRARANSFLARGRRGSKHTLGRVPLTCRDRGGAPTNARRARILSSFAGRGPNDRRPPTARLDAVRRHVVRSSASWRWRTLPHPGNRARFSTAWANEAVPAGRSAPRRRHSRP